MKRVRCEGSGISPCENPDGCKIPWHYNLKPEETKMSPAKNNNFQLVTGIITDNRCAAIFAHVENCRCWQPEETKMKSLSELKSISKEKVMAAIRGMDIMKKDRVMRILLEERDRALKEINDRKGDR